MHRSARVDTALAVLGIRCVVTFRGRDSCLGSTVHAVLGTVHQTGGGELRDREAGNYPSTTGRQILGLHPAAVLGLASMIFLTIASPSPVPFDLVVT